MTNSTETYQAAFDRLNGLTLKALSHQLTATGVKGRSGAKTKAEKVELIMTACLGFPTATEVALEALNARKEAEIPPHGDEVEDQIIYHRQFLSPQTVPAIVKKWLDNKDKGGVVAVLDTTTGLYMTFASHARTLARQKDWDSMSVEDGITLISLDPRYTWHTASMLRLKGQELTLID